MSPIPNYTNKLPEPSNHFFRDFQQRLTAEWTARALQSAQKKITLAASLHDWEEALAFWNEVKCHVETHFETVQLAFQCYTEDKEIEAEEKRLREEVEPIYTELNGKIRPLLLNSPFFAQLRDKIGEQYFLQLKIQQDAFDPKNIEIETRLNQVLADHTKLTGSAEFEVDGKKYPLAHIKKFSTSPDPKLREASYRSYAGWFLGHRTELEGLFDKALQYRNEMAHTLGHSNFIPLGYQKMRRVDYGQDEVAALREQIREVLVPVTSKIRQWQAKSLGTEKIRYCDLDFFPEWRVGDPKVSIEEQVPAALKVYEKLSPELGRHFQRMIRERLIDLPARPGKAPGAFCTSFSDFRVPYIFLNSVNAPADITTLLHETGHSFQAWESASIDLSELRHPTLEACEVHSMGMEFLAHPYYEEFFHPQDAESFRKLHLAESLLLLPYIAMVDEFQHLVYSGKAAGAEGRAQAWETLGEKYMPGIDYGAAPDWKRHRWIRQLHIFHVPFYYIDYAIAQIGAWQLWVLSLKDRAAAMKKYLQLCRLGGTKPLTEFFKAGDLRLPFEKGMLGELVEEILRIEPIV